MICILFICVNVAKNKFSLSSKFWDKKIDLQFSLKLNMLLSPKMDRQKFKKLKKWTKIVMKITFCCCFSTLITHAYQ